MSKQKPEIQRLVETLQGDLGALNEGFDEVDKKLAALDGISMDSILASTKALVTAMATHEKQDKDATNV